MDIPLNDETLFQAGDINICIFPHLSEFLVVDSRATVPGGPRTHLLATEQVLDPRFFDDVEDSIHDLIRHMDRTFNGLSQLPQQVDDAVREHALEAIMRSIEDGPSLQSDDDADVSVFLCVGRALSMGAEQVDETVRAMLGHNAEDPQLSYCLSEMRRLMDEERGQAKAEERDLAERAVYGDNEYYFTIWSQVEPQDQRSQ